MRGQPITAFTIIFWGAVHWGRLPGGEVPVIATMGPIP
ncbi:protein of unknown function [Azospirillum lipoferum 4B]|uniref:Uncharacterized protein n=1 Tax=Azospirillum lipoferum (strain 4B) TaxID=862719 RepID=G7Z3Y4_AZOL4|nr:protein of unknown function [Azospirillum lipoferum 4B]